MSLRLLIVADGERDSHILPAILKTLLGCQVDAQFSGWARLHEAGKGFDRKLKYAIRKAMVKSLIGLVAVVDVDHSPKSERLKAIKAGREHDRTNGVSFPTAIGAANPHVEAWLLDDPTAVREALRLGNDCLIPSVQRTKSPKTEIDALRKDEFLQTNNWSQLRSWFRFHDA